MSRSLRDTIVAAVPADGFSIANLKLFRAVQGSVKAAGEPVTQGGACNECQDQR